MASRTRKKAETTEDTSFNPAEFDPAMQQQANEIVQSVAESTRIEPDATVTGGPVRANESGFASRHTTSGNSVVTAKKPKIQIPDPYGVEDISGDGNYAQLLKEEPNRLREFPGAWVIRFEKNPNKMTDEEGVKYSKERPHPVLKMLKDEGYRWGFADGDGKGGWGKTWTEGHYTFAEHTDARKVLTKAAEMIGAKVEQGQGILD